MRTLRHARPLLAVCATVIVVAGCGGSGHRSNETSPPPTATAPPTANAPTAPTAGTGVTYGIGDAPGWFARCAPTDPTCCTPASGRCRVAQTEGYYDASPFLALTTPASAHRVRDVRLFVEYDAAQEWNGSSSAPGCVSSRVLNGAWNDVYGVQPAGESLSELLAGVIEARADGLTPVVAIAGYPFDFARPAWDAPTPDPTTVGGYWEYRCGVQGILDALSRLPDWEQPHIWEPMNEPDGFSIFHGSDAPQASTCTPGATPQPDGAAKAACDEVVASRVIHDFAAHHADTVMAGTFEHLDPAYLAAYAARIGGELSGAAYPRTWSAHDYRDVDQGWDGSRATQLAGFDEALARDTDGRASSLWITEAATVLTSHVRIGDCPAVGVDASGTLGACLNGSPARQATATAAFFALPQVASAVPITHLFWYQFESAPYWDSGLLDTAGQPRAAYCVFYGHGTCGGSPDAPGAS